MLESLNWIFAFFLSLLNKQEGQTFISYLDGPRTKAEVSQTHRINHASETNIHQCWTDRRNAGISAQNILKSSSDIDSSSLPSPPHPLTLPMKPPALEGKAAHCPFSSSQILLSYKWFSHPSFLHSPDPSFFFLLVPITLSAGRFSAFYHLSCLKPFNGVNWWGNNGADRWDH